MGLVEDGRDWRQWPDLQEMKVMEELIAGCVPPGASCLILSDAGNMTDGNVVVVIAVAVVVVLVKIGQISKSQTFSLQHFISGGK